MKLPSLRDEVLQANLELVRRGLVLYTFGNASGIDRQQGLVVIKPSGVPYETMKAEHLVVVDLDGIVVEGLLRPSSDLPTHLILYRAFELVGGVAHTHSRAGTSWAQARREIPCFGTTHADYFHGPVPVTKPLTPSQINSDYEANTGHAIVRRFAKLDPLRVPAVLVSSHAPFCWGKNPAEAAHIAVVLEEVAAIALQTLAANPKARPILRHLHDKHFLRKHGTTKYYGQKKLPLGPRELALETSSREKFLKLLVLESERHATKSSRRVIPSAQLCVAYSKPCGRERIRRIPTSSSSRPTRALRSTARTCTTGSSRQRVIG